MSKNWLILGVLSFGVGFGISLTVDRDIKRAALTGLITLPATAAGVSIVERQRKLPQSNQLSSVLARVAELEKQETALRQLISQLHNQAEILKQQEAIHQQDIATAFLEKQKVETTLTTLQREFEQLQAQVLLQQSRKQDLTQALATLETQKQQLEAGSHLLQTQLQEFRNQETEINLALAAVADEKQKAEANLDANKTELSQLQTQVATQQRLKATIEQDSVALEAQKQQSKAEFERLQTWNQDLRQQESKLNQSFLAIASQKQQLETDCDSLQIELTQLQAQVAELQQQRVTLAAQKERLAAEITQFQVQAKTEASSQASTSSRQHSSRKLSKSRKKVGTSFMDSEYTKDLWENQILPYWSHRDRPAGQRFLGSIRFQRQDSDKLLNIVSQNLQQLDRFTYTSLTDEFYELEQNWLKILTFALSEYAYYYSSERFWQGFCNRLDIDHNQRVEINLRRIVDEGINLLGLVRAKGGYKYVSTLWLQSGVPEQNLAHFAQLVQEIADEYGWWELAHTPAEDLSQVLLSFCEEKHPQWGTLINFLKSSYSEDTDTEPISGQLLQGIAIVAQELERQKASPQALQDENQREELLSNYYLPQNFFLRNWNALIQVLTPRSGSSRSRGIISRRSKPLFMSLDVANSWNTHLVLPKQALWKPAWRDLRGRYCQIPQANWEDTIPTTGDLLVPELLIEVDGVSENWNCQLLDHNHQQLEEWRYPGINNYLPCLIFNALTGEHLPLHLPSAIVNGVEEVICFTPKHIQPHFASGIEVLDSYIPSSIRGWRGWLIRLTNPESSIVLTIPEINLSQVIIWKLVTDNEPVLTGLRLQGKKPIYLEPPTFWYPPINDTLNLNILIENITRRTIVARSIETLSSHHRWFAIPLAQWITQAGCYEAHFWLEQKRWSYQFEVRSRYQISERPKFNKLQIRSHSGFSAIDLPIKHNNPEKFWSEIIKIEGVLPLEKIILFLSNGNEKIPYELQANTSGDLEIRLSYLYNLLPESDWYALNYQRLGLEPQRLLELETSPQTLSWTWANQAIHLSGLLPNKLYSLSCWNLLLPDREPVEIKIPLISDDATATVVPLNLPTGIYHIQLVSYQQLPENIGWWCDSGQYDIPKDIYGDEARENYCYTILDSRETTETLLTAINQLNLDFDIQQVEAGIYSLEKQRCQFPKWLSSDALTSKLKVILEAWKRMPIPDRNDSKDKPETENYNLQQIQLFTQGSWYLVRISSKRRNSFLKHLELVIAKNKLQELILEIRIPQASVYEDIVLLNLSNRKEAYTHLQKIEYFQRVEPRPLKPEEVGRMLGAK